MRTENDDLEPIEPRKAQELYLKHKSTDYREQTVQAHKYRTNHFIQWCEENGIENLNTLSGRDIQEFRLWRQEDGDLKRITLNQHMSTLRVFLKWLASVEAVPADLYEKVMIPRVNSEQERREETLEAENAQEILAHLSKFHYASVKHAIFTLLWETGIRLGAANSLDVGDFDPAEARIDLVHRPDEGTQLKNGVSGERPIALSPTVVDVVEAYVETNRNAVTDDYGRDPLFTTKRGRMHRGTIRNHVYRMTAPCFRNEPCPDCTGESEKKCPEAVSPHAIRRGSITHFLTEDVPAEVVGDRMNVSRDVLDKHYDRRSAEVKLEQRRAYLEEV
ncbi:tyrosine-type recombinase/integrase [Halodesulfurarchaeum sp.]|uniref:tyrosine-type recombinase/integrase n=1 Tax=Halodesulfurarchaeum sp. TaxID=1980530 RepID=UPI002FC2815C